MKLRITMLPIVALLFAVCFMLNAYGQGSSEQEPVVWEQSDVLNESGKTLYFAFTDSIAGKKVTITATTKQEEPRKVEAGIHSGHIDRHFYLRRVLGWETYWTDTEPMPTSTEFKFVFEGRNDAPLGPTLTLEQMVAGVTAPPGAVNLKVQWVAANGMRTKELTYWVDTIRFSGDASACVSEGEEISWEPFLDFQKDATPNPDLAPRQYTFTNACGYGNAKNFPETTGVALDKERTVTVKLGQVVSLTYSVSPSP